MLSQERVIALLYEKTFPMTSTEMQNGDDIDDMQELERQRRHAGVLWTRGRGGPCVWLHGDRQSGL